MNENAASDGSRSCRTLTGEFTEWESTESAFNFLHEMSYLNNNIYEKRKKHFSRDTQEPEKGTKAFEGAGKGSADGRTIGVIPGVTTAIGTSVANIIT